MFLTNESVGAGAVVGCDAIDASAPVLAGVRPALVPVCLTLHASVAVHAVAGIGAEK